MMALKLKFQDTSFRFSVQTQITILFQYIPVINVRKIYVYPVMGC